jgi:hypothetical protein
MRSFSRGGDFGPRGGNFSRRGGRDFAQGGRFHDGGRFHGRHRHGNRFFVGLPFYGYGYYDDDYGYYGGGCGWLYRRAVYTGSPYWWRRYELCIS